MVCCGGLQKAKVCGISIWLTDCRDFCNNLSNTWLDTIINSLAQEKCKETIKLVCRDPFHKAVRHFSNNLSPSVEKKELLERTYIDRAQLPQRITL